MPMNVIRQACVARRVSTQRVHTSVDVWKATLSCLTRGLVRLSEVGLRFMTIAKHIVSQPYTATITHNKEYCCDKSSSANSSNGETTTTQNKDQCQNSQYL